MMDEAGETVTFAFEVGDRIVTLTHPQIISVEYEFNVLTIEAYWSSAFTREIQERLEGQLKWSEGKKIAHEVKSNSLIKAIYKWYLLTD